jgi:hypothetical protein
MITLTQILIMRADEYLHGRGSSILRRIVGLRLRKIADFAVEIKDSLI